MGGGRREAGRLLNGLRRDAAATFQEAEGIYARKAHGFEFLTESGDGGTGEILLRGEFDFRVGKAGNVLELPGDLRRERKESIDPFIHHTDSLSD